MSIIPGPQTPTSLAGNPITSILSLCPPCGNEESHFSIVYYNNKVGVWEWSEEKIAVSLEANDSIVCEEDVQSLLDLCDQSLGAMLSKWSVCSEDKMRWHSHHLMECDWKTIDNKHAKGNTPHTGRENRECISYSTSSGSCSRYCFL